MKLLAVSILIIISAIAVTLFQSNTEKQGKNPFTLDTASVDSISIEFASKNILINREKSDWSLRNPDYPADQGLINGLFKSLTDMKIMDVCSKNPAKFSVYSLGKNRRKLVLKAKDREAVIYVGKSSPDFQTSFVMLNAKGPVYRISKNLSLLCATDYNHWIRKNLVQIRDKNIVSIRLEKDSSLEVINNNGWKLRKGSVNFELNEHETEMLLSGINNLVSSGLAKNMSTSSSETPILKLSVRSETSECLLGFFSRDNLFYATDHTDLPMVIVDPLAMGRLSRCWELLANK